MTDTALNPRVADPITEEGDHDRMAHIVLEGLKLEDKFIPAGTPVVLGIVEGVPVKALCGKVWVPTRNPSRFGLCPTCKELAEAQGWKVPTA